MSEYVFRFPAGTPKLTYDSLREYLAGHWRPSVAGGRYARIGTTVTITNRDRDREPGVTFQLYDRTTAIIRPGRVEFPFTRDAHMATTEWIGRIVRDNGIGNGIWRMRRRAADPLIPGPRGFVGPLVIDGDRDRPVNGYGYQVNSRDSGSEPWCNHDGPERPGERCECGLYVPPPSDYTRRLAAGPVEDNSRVNLDNALYS